MKNCPKCQVTHNKAGIFCSRACANSRAWTDDDKQKKSNSIKSSENFKKSVLKRRIKNSFFIRKCQCGRDFQVRYNSSKKKFCSKVCDTFYTKRGGYRNGSGRSKSGYYKGIYCGSTYELCWVIYSIDNGVRFKRFDHLINGEKFSYYPDFLLEDGKTIIEIKGFEDPQKVEYKTKLAESQGFLVKVMYEEDLKDVFSHVEEKYKTKNFYTLYDDYKPLFDYLCSSCGIAFSKEKKIKTEKHFCTRKCAGEYRAKINHKKA